jgi:hypothetical protein
MMNLLDTPPQNATAKARFRGRFERFGGEL